MSHLGKGNVFFRHSALGGPAGPLKAAGEAARASDGTRLGEAVQSALAALEALKRAEAEAPEVTKERREMPWDENPEGTMVETGEA